MVIKARDVLEDSLLGLAASLEAREFNALALEGSEQRLHRSIVVAVPFPTHASSVIGTSRRQGIFATRRCV